MDLLSGAAGLLGPAILPFLPAAADYIATQDTNETNTNNANAANRTQAEIAERNIALQREFAQNGLRWRIEDAQAAGIHPLAALGAPGASFSPVTVGTTVPNYQSPMSGTGAALRDMGQNISRAVQSTMTPQEKIYSETTNALKLENMQLQNDLLRGQVSHINKQNQPATPSVAPRVITKPSEQTASSSDDHSRQAGSVNDYGFVRTASGGLAIVPSTDVKERIEDQLIPELSWAVRNYGSANLGLSKAPSEKEFPTKPGHKWSWDVWRQEFRQRPVNKPWYRGLTPLDD
nr:MAG: DNA pilot protein [Microvirus sp.]